MEDNYKGRILLIDDDDDDIKDIYLEIITTAGYKVDVASDGEEGLNKIIQDSYNLVLLDIMMPKLDGLGVLRALKEKYANLSLPPIVILSALNQDEIVSEAMSLGAKGFMKKSDLTPEDALKKIDEYIKTNPGLKS